VAHLLRKKSCARTIPTTPITSSGKIIAGFYKPDVATILGKAFGESYLGANERRYFKKHFNADGSPRIVLYGTDWCGYCAALRTELRDSHIDYTDIDVEKTGEKDTMLETMGIGGYPATWIGYQRVNGSKLADIKSALAAY
jgi:glutaredoxin